MEKAAWRGASKARAHASRGLRVAGSPSKEAPGTDPEIGGERQVWLEDKGTGSGKALGFKFQR